MAKNGSRAKAHICHGVGPFCQLLLKVQMERKHTARVIWVWEWSQQKIKGLYLVTYKLGLCGWRGFQSQEGRKLKSEGHLIFQRCGLRPVTRKSRSCFGWWERGTPKKKFEEAYLEGYLERHQDCEIRLTWECNERVEESLHHLYKLTLTR